MLCRLASTDMPATVGGEDPVAFAALEAGLLLEDIFARCLVASFFSVRCMRSCRPFSWGRPGLMRSSVIPSLSHHTDSFDRL